MLPVISLFVGRALATDVLVPDAIPLSLGDFALAARVQKYVVAEVGKGTYDVDTGAEIRSWAGGDADACFDEPTCPGDLWGRTDARLAVVMSVGEVDGRTRVVVKFFGPHSAEPVRVLEDSLPPGTEPVFAKDLAFTTSEVLASLPPRAAGVALTPEWTVPASDYPEAAARQEAEREAERLGAERAWAKAQREAAVLARLEAARLDAEAAATEAAGLAAIPTVAEPPPAPPPTPVAVAPPLERAVVRPDVAAPRGGGARRVFSIEAAGGVGLGDTDRGYGAWVAVESAEAGFVSTAASTWQGSGTGADGGVGGAAWVAITAAPVAAVDLSVSVGLQSGRTYVDAGWECAGCTTPSSAVPVESTETWAVWVQPKVRVVPFTFGRVRPYALVSGDLSLHRPVTLDVPGVEFPAETGSALIGVGVGLGAYVDLVHAASLFVEVPASFTVSPQWVSYDSVDVTAQPAPLATRGGFLRAFAGVSLGF